MRASITILYLKYKYPISLFLTKKIIFCNSFFFIWSSVKNTWLANIRAKQNKQKKIKDAEQNYQSNQKLLHHYQHAKNQLFINIWDTAYIRVPWNKRSRPFFDHTHPKTIEVTFSVVEFLSAYKNQYIPSIHSCDTANFRICDHSFLTMFTLKNF